MTTRGRALLAAAVLAALAACSREKSPEAYVQSGEQFLARGDASSAEVEFRNALQQAPKHGAAFRLRGMARLQMRLAVGAEADLRRALDLGESPQEVLPALARALVLQGQADAIIKQFDGAPPLAAPAGEAEVRASQGDAHLARGELEKARQQYAAALAAVPGHVPARFGMVRVVAAQGRLDGAAAELDALIAAMPGQPEAHYLKAQLAALRGDRAAARQSLQRTLEIDKRHVRATADLVSQLADDRQEREAEALLDALSADLLASEPRLVVLKALLELRRGAVADARARVGKILATQPEHVGARLAAGQIELQDRHDAEAENHLGIALSKVRTMPLARELLATAQLRQGKAAKALDTLAPLLAATPTPPRTLLLGGEAALAMGDLVRAAELLAQARAGGGDDPVTLFRVGQVAVLRGDFDAGVGALQAAAALDAVSGKPDIALATLHLQRRAFDQALAAARTLAAKLPGQPLAPALAGEALAGAGDRAGARREYDAALALQADLPLALRGLARLDLAEGRAADAVRRYEALIAKNPDESLVLALAELQAGLPGDAAVQTLAKAMAARPASLTLPAGLVRLHFARHEPDAAVAAAEKAAAARPDEARLLDLLATAQEGAGRSADALRTLRLLAEASPQQTAPRVRLAAAQVRQGDFAGAAETLRAARQIAPDDLAILSDLAGAYANDGKFERAFELARNVQSKAPQRAAGLVLTGDIHAKKGEPVEAERAYRAALKTEPTASAAAAKLARLLGRTGRGGEANTLLAQWLAAHPNDTLVRMQVADAAAGAGRLKEAAQHYERVLQREPAHVGATNNLAFVRGGLNDPRALETARRAAQLAPSNPDVLDTLGVLLLRHGDAAEAVRALAAARALAPQRPELRLHLAKGLLRAERTSEAKAELVALAAEKADFAGKSEVAGLLGKLN